MTHTVMRFVQHTIRHEPAGGITAEAFCATYGCASTSGPLDELDAAQLWCLQHTGRTGHDLFRRVLTDHARVTRHADATPTELSSDSHMPDECEEFP